MQEGVEEGVGYSRVGNSAVRESYACRMVGEYSGARLADIGWRLPPTRHGTTSINKQKPLADVLTGKMYSKKTSKEGKQHHYYYTTTTTTTTTTITPFFNVSLFSLPL